MRLRPDLILAMLWQLATRTARIRAYYAANTEVKLNIGGGRVLKPGWLNTDAYPRYQGVIMMDATKRFPLPDASVDFAYSEHMIEHVPLPAFVCILDEIHRVLRVRGKVRLATPGLDNILEMKPGSLTSIQLRWVRSSNNTWEREFEDACPDNPIYAINRLFRGFDHKFIYDRRTLAELLERAGFVGISFCDVGQSATPQLRNIETHAGAEYAFETVIVEAQKR